MSGGPRPEKHTQEMDERATNTAAGEGEGDGEGVEAKLCTSHVVKVCTSRVAKVCTSRGGRWSLYLGPSRATHRFTTPTTCINCKNARVH